jgi:hypothetical protein
MSSTVYDFIMFVLYFKELQGIPKQSTIGFLTIMEYLHYCEVGWYLKNPKWPIWLLASETHLTVFFSKVSQHVI